MHRLKVLEADAQCLAGLVAEESAAAYQSWTAPVGSARSNAGQPVGPVTAFQSELYAVYAEIERVKAELASRFRRGRRG